MEETLASRIVAKIAVAIFIIAALDLVFINWWILKSDKQGLASIVTEKVSNKSVGGSEMTDKTSASPTTTPSATPIVVNNQVVTTNSVALPSPSPSPQQVVTQTVVQTPNREIFVPMGAGESKSGTFADIAGTEVTIDTTKYSAIDYVVFEASVWVDGGNGRAWAQIKNVTDNNPLIESQISNPTSTSTLRTSGKIPIQSGSKTYIVQARSEMTDFAAHVGNARLKIVLK